MYFLTSHTWGQSSPPSPNHPLALGISLLKGLLWLQGFWAIACLFHGSLFPPLFSNDVPGGQSGPRSGFLQMEPEGGHRQPEHTSPLPITAQIGAHWRSVGEWVFPSSWHVHSQSPGCLLARCVITVGCPVFLGWRGLDLFRRVLKHASPPTSDQKQKWYQPSSPVTPAAAVFTSCISVPSPVAFSF